MAENIKISGPGGVEAIMRQKQADGVREKAAKNIPISDSGGLVFPA